MPLGMRRLSELLAWLQRGFNTTIPETFAVGAAVLVVIAWWIFARWYQRCPHCRRLVRRASPRTLRCPRCGRQYYEGVRHVG
jgi:Zn finger protein HypA/HybF involved in hydrogenase expression